MGCHIGTGFILASTSSAESVAEDARGAKGRGLVAARDSFFLPSVETGDGSWPPVALVSLSCITLRESLIASMSLVAFLHRHHTISRNAYGC